MTSLPFKTYSDFLHQFFPEKIQKIGIDAGFSCPNRDGTIGTKGCVFCNNKSFVPDYCQPTQSITTQLTQGINFFRRKYPKMSYLAYFQAYTGTHAPLNVLASRYEEALSVPGVVGLVIATRPDCLSDPVLQLLADFSRQTFVQVEVGVESVHDATLQRIGRGHTFQCAADAIARLAEKQIKVGVHMILGLPGESREDILEQARRIARLPIDTVKLHQLQVIRHTPMEAYYAAHPEQFLSLTPESYAELVLDYITLLPENFAFDRFLNQSPPHLLAREGWGIKNYQFVDILAKCWQRRQS